MFRKILFPTDFSNSAGNALRYVKKLKEAGTEEVFLLHVIDDYHLEIMTSPCEWKDEDPDKCVKEIEERLRRKAMENLEEIALTEIPVKVETIVRRGKPYKEILGTAEVEQVSLIVMGSHGRGKIKEMLLGSVAENVVRHSRVPVLIVKCMEES